MRSLRSTRTFVTVAAMVAVTGLALAACGGSGGASAASAQPPKDSTGKPVTVGVAGTSLGSILVDSHGRTLYLFKNDTGMTSTCTGSCATFWPPLTAPASPTVGRGAHASLLGTTTRQDGTSQLTYNGHPVYLYGGDHSPGDTNGQGVVAFGASWFALSSSGNQVSGSASKPGTGLGY